MNTALAREILGVKLGSTPEEIKKSYRIAARKTHPDVGGDDEAFMAVQEAYEVLTSTSVSKSDLLNDIINKVDVDILERAKRRKYIEWLREAKRNRYSYGWASHKYRKQYGVWPKLWWAIDTDDPKSFYIAAKRLAKRRRYRKTWPVQAFMDKFGRYPDYI